VNSDSFQERLYLKETEAIYQSVVRVPLKQLYSVQWLRFAAFASGHIARGTGHALPPVTKDL